VPQRSNFKEIWAPQYRQRTLMLMVMNFCTEQAAKRVGKGDKEGVQQAMGNTGALAGEQRGQPALMTVIFGTLFALQNSPVLLVICGFMITWSNAWLTTKRVGKGDKEGVQQAMGNTGALAGEQRGQPVTETQMANCSVSADDGDLRHTVRFTK
jgi:hypothetical protein